MSMRFIANLIELQNPKNNTVSCGTSTLQFLFDSLHQQIKYSVQNFHSTVKVFGPHVNRYLNFLCDIYVSSNSNRQVLGIEGKQMCR